MSTIDTVARNEKLASVTRYMVSFVIRPSQELENGSLVQRLVEEGMGRTNLNCQLPRP